MTATTPPRVSVGRGLEPDTGAKGGVGRCPHTSAGEGAFPHAALKVRESVGRYRYPENIFPAGTVVVSIPPVSGTVCTPPLVVGGTAPYPPSPPPYSPEQGAPVRTHTADCRVSVTPVGRGLLGMVVIMPEKARGRNMEVGESGMPRPRDTPNAVREENAHTSAVSTMPSRLEEVTPTQAVAGVVPRVDGPPPPAL